MTTRQSKPAIIETDRAGEWGLDCAELVQSGLTSKTTEICTQNWQHCSHKYRNREVSDTDIETKVINRKYHRLRGVSQKTRKSPLGKVR